MSMTEDTDVSAEARILRLEARIDRLESKRVTPLTLAVEEGDVMLGFQPGGMAALWVAIDTGGHRHYYLNNSHDIPGGRGRGMNPIPAALIAGELTRDDEGRQIFRPHSKALPEYELSYGEFPKPIGESRAPRRDQ